jgi:hypothetical protein
MRPERLKRTRTQYSDQVPTETFLFGRGEAIAIDSGEASPTSQDLSCPYNTLQKKEALDIESIHQRTTRHLTIVS